MWNVEFSDAFAADFVKFPADVQDEMLAQSKLLERFGPRLGRPRVDTLKGSKHANMKELRFAAGGGVWRVAFAFDPQRSAILLVGGDKSGGSQKRFYRKLVEVADARFDDHLRAMKSGLKGKRP